ncbi:MAG: DUF5320 domain-containing protein [Thermodesulfobacteriota bacterium]
MYYGRGFGRGLGFGRGMGFGFRGSSPPWPYVGIGRGGLPRCWAYGVYGWPGPGYAPGIYPPGGWPFYGSPYSREEEIRFLKDQANFIREELEAIDARIKELEKEKSEGGAA